MRLLRNRIGPLAASLVLLVPVIGMLQSPTAGARSAWHPAAVFTTVAHSSADAPASSADLPALPTPPSAPPTAVSEADPRAGVGLDRAAGPGDASSVAHHAAAPADRAAEREAATERPTVASERTARLGFGAPAFLVEGDEPEDAGVVFSLASRPPGWRRDPTRSRIAHDAPFGATSVDVSESRGPPYRHA